MSESEAESVSFNPRGWSYQTGRVNRKANLVIRVRGVLKTVDHNELEHTDSTDPGKEWSQEELSVSTGSSANLFIVVGEYLPQGAGPNANSTTVVPRQQNALILVARVYNKVNSFFVLVNKVHGLCMARKLPGGKKGTSDRVTFYEDYVDDLNTPRSQPQRRLMAWSNLLTKVREEWKAANVHVRRPSNRDGTRETGNHEYFAQSARNSLRLFITTADRSILQHTRELIDKAEKALPDTLNDESTRLRMEDGDSFNHELDDFEEGPENKPREESEPCSEQDIVEDLMEDMEAGPTIPKTDRSTTNIPSSNMVIRLGPSDDSHQAVDIESSTVSHISTDACSHVSTHLHHDADNDSVSGPSQGDVSGALLASLDTTPPRSLNHGISAAGNNTFMSCHQRAISSGTLVSLAATPGIEPLDAEAVGAANSPQLHRQASSDSVYNADGAGEVIATTHAHLDTSSGAPHVEPHRTASLPQTLNDSQVISDDAAPVSPPNENDETERPDALGSSSNSSSDGYKDINSGVEGRSAKRKRAHSQTIDSHMKRRKVQNETNDEGEPQYKEDEQVNSTLTEHMKALNVRIQGLMAEAQSLRAHIKDDTLSEVRSSVAPMADRARTMSVEKVKKEEEDNAGSKDTKDTKTRQPKTAKSMRKARLIRMLRQIKKSRANKAGEAKKVKT